MPLDIAVQVNQLQRLSLSTAPLCAAQFLCGPSIYFWETRAALALPAVTIMHIMYLVRMDRCVHCKAQSTHVHVYRYCKTEHLNSL